MKVYEFPREYGPDCLPLVGLAETQVTYSQGWCREEGLTEIVQDFAIVDDSGRYFSRTLSNKPDDLRVIRFELSLMGISVDAHEDGAQLMERAITAYEGVPCLAFHSRVPHRRGTVILLNNSAADLLLEPVWNWMGRH